MIQKATPFSYGRKPSDYEEGMRHFSKKRWDAALQSFQAVDASNCTETEKAEIAYYLGLCYTKLERYNDALLYLEQVVTGNVSTLRVCQCRLTLAYIYAITRRAKMAEFELDRLVKSGVKSVQIYTMLGFSAWAQKEFDRAVEFYEQALEIDQTNTTALNGLGYILVDQGKDTKRGLELCKKAVDRRPQNPAYLDSLGWAYFKNGDTGEARNFLRRALDIAPRQKEISSHMKTVLGNDG
ncbi:MAG: tetratricopeptide repeat protein [Spirochaetaceae bacterium]|jgi:tetratricopeptide (TPR) repeat protein|nr:tetratricopeptide repeat protein [Spirochaetaceae bacterium]